MDLSTSSLLHLPLPLARTWHFFLLFLLLLWLCFWLVLSLHLVLFGFELMHGQIQFDHHLLAHLRFLQSAASAFAALAMRGFFFFSLGSFTSSFFSWTFSTTISWDSSSASLFFAAILPFSSSCSSFAACLCSSTISTSVSSSSTALLAFGSLFFFSFLLAVLLSLRCLPPIRLLGLHPQLCLPWPSSLVLLVPPFLSFPSQQL